MKTELTLTFTITAKYNVVLLKWQRNAVEIQLKGIINTKNE